MVDIEERPDQAASWIQFEINDAPQKPVRAHQDAHSLQEHKGKSGTKAASPSTKHAPYAISPATFRDVFLLLRDAPEHASVAPALAARWNESVTLEMLKIPVTDEEMRWPNLQMLSPLIPGFAELEKPENAHLRSLSYRFASIPN
jgi:hypothetical protein